MFYLVCMSRKLFNLKNLFNLFYLIYLISETTLSNCERYHEIELYQKLFCSS